MMLAAMTVRSQSCPVVVEAPTLALPPTNASSETFNEMLASYVPSDFFKPIPAFSKAAGISTEQQGPELVLLLVNGCSTMLQARSNRIALKDSCLPDVIWTDETISNTWEDIDNLILRE